MKATQKAKWITSLLWARRSTIVTLGTPLLLSPLLAIEMEGLTPEASRCLYLFLLMAVYWMTESIDISATALLPMSLLPLFGIMKTGDVSRSYQRDTIMLLMGGFIVAIAVESSNIHKRISILMLRLAGSNMRMLMLGFMLPTWFLSMWMSNTATTAVMVPILKAVIDELKTAAADTVPADNEAHYNSKGRVDVMPMADLHDSELRALRAIGTLLDSHSLNRRSTLSKSTSTLHDPESGHTAEMLLQKKLQEWTEVHRALTLCVCYSSTIGGMATLTGNPPNIVLVDNLRLVSKKYGDYDFNMNFVTWMVLGLPLSIFLLIVCWVVLQMLYLGFRCKKNFNEQGSRIKAIVDREYEKLGRVTFNEVIVVLMVLLLVVLWLSKDPGNVGGWQDLFKKGYISDTTAAMLVSVLLFVIPANRPVATLDNGAPSGPSPGCLTWRAVHEKMPWGVVVLIGGGFALAEAIEVSGLAKVIGHVLGEALGGLEDWSLVLTVSLICSAITQMTSNTTVATLFLPIIALAAEEKQIHPLYMMFPACISTSFAFILPVATPSNAIVFATGTLRIIDMVKGGVILTIFAILFATLATTTWGKTYFHMDTFPYTSQNVSAINGSLT